MGFLGLNRKMRAEGIHKAHEGQVLPSLHSEDVDHVGKVQGLLPN